MPEPNQQPWWKRIPAFWLYPLFAIFLIVTLISGSLQVLRSNPSRQASTQIPGIGLVTVTLTLDPFPSQAGEPVRLSARAENSQGGLIQVGQNIPYTLSLKDSQDSLSTGSLDFQPDGSGYNDTMTIPYPGDYWVSMDLPEGAYVRFTITVEP